MADTGSSASRELHSRRPGAFARLGEIAPDVLEAYERLGAVTGGAGPLDARTIGLVKLAVSVGQGSWRGVHAHARKALEAGASPEALRHVAVAALPSVGLHSSLDALRWIEEVIDELR